MLRPQGITTTPGYQVDRESAISLAGTLLAFLLFMVSLLVRRVSIPVTDGGMVAHTFDTRVLILELGKRRQAALEFKASLVYIVSSWPGRGM